MSSNEQHTEQVGEVAQDETNVQSGSTAPETTGDKVVESTEKPVVEEETEKVEEPEAEPAKDEEVEKTESESAEVDETKALDVDEKAAEPAENGEPSEEKPAEVEANRDNTEKTESDVAGDEVNGVHKRKAENGADAVAENEKSPKKPKVVDEPDQAKVEETAA